MDVGLSFEEVKQILTNAFDLRVKLYYQSKRRKRLAKQITYLGIGLLSLANGMRPIEGMVAFKTLIRKPEKEFRILVAKQKTRKKSGDLKKDYEFRQRWVYVPTKVFANHSLLSEAVYVGFGSLDNLFPDKFEDPKERVKYLVYEGKEGRIRVPPYIKYIQRYSDFFRKNFGINPYTFRKAWENYIAKKVNPEFIAKYEGRVDLDTFLDYIREQESKNLIIPYIDI